MTANQNPGATQSKTNWLLIVLIAIGGLLVATFISCAMFGIFLYVLSDDESLQPGDKAGPGMPAAEGPPADAAE